MDTTIDKYDYWLFRKPLQSDTIAENVLQHGVGGLNIDECRVEYINDKDKTQALAGDAFKRKDLTDKGWSRPWMEDQSRIDQINQEAKERAQLGRWPANLIHDGSDEVVGLFPETTSGGGDKHGRKASSFCASTDWEAFKGTSSGGDTGSAARFFYTAKASRSDRNEGLTIKNTHATVKPTDLMQYLCRLITPPDGIVLDPFMGSGSTGKACMLEGFRFIGIEMEEEYVVIARARIIHTLKPEVQEYYKKKKQSKGGKVKEAANEKVNEEGDLS